jgi:thymidylate synthase (FAD)
MSVKLISLSNPLIPGLQNAEDLITYCARVSNPSNQLNIETAPKLINYLIKHKHWSPFEMVSATIEIQTSRAIAAQILRHRSFSFQEFSQRYSEITDLEPLQWRKQGETNRQVGSEEVDLLQEYKDMVKSAQKTCLKTYEMLLEYGIAKECARMILPLNTKTTLYMTGNLRSWIHYIELRKELNTQKEHREIVLNIQDILIEHFPNISEALKWQK